MATTASPQPAIEEPRSLPRRGLGLLAAAPCSLRETGVAAVLFVALAFAAYGPYVTRGGFTRDDWAYASEGERAGGLFDMVDNLLVEPENALMSAGGRPLGALYFATTHTLFGANAGLHLALSIVLVAALSLLLYLVLRELELERLHAGAISGLVLLFPASDSVRFWPAATTAVVALSFFLLGLLLALRALRAGGRQGVVLHAASLACYAASMLQYEIAAGGIALAGLVYMVRAERRPALVRWAADLAVIGVCLVLLRSTTTRAVAPISDYVDRARDMQGEARQLLTQVGIQDGPVRLPTIVTVLVLALSVVFLARVRRRDDPVKKQLGRWLVLGLAGMVAIGTGYSIFIGAADTFYMPLRPGIGNRTNAAAAIGYVVLLYSLAMLSGLLLVKAIAVVRRASPSSAWASAFAVGAAVALGVVWLAELNDDRRAWQRAHAIGVQTLEVLRVLPKPPGGSTIYSFGMPGETAPLVPAFSASWDLTGAVRVLWDDQSLRAVPSPTLSRDAPENVGIDSGIACRPTSVEPRGYQWNPQDASPYGRTLFVDVPTGRSEVIRSRSQCEAAVIRFFPDGHAEAGS